MGRTTYIYVDGESHFIRSEECWRALFRPESTLEQLAETNPIDQRNSAIPRTPALRFPDSFPGGRFAIHRKAQFFWDRFCLTGLEMLLEMPARAIYFSGCSGDENDRHDARVLIRGCEFEPVLVDERRELLNRRQNTLAQNQLIEKPKGVDIALAVRMLEDAYAGTYDACCLFTSDIDYIPLIQAVRRTGKVVCVLGYRQGLGERSPFEFVPDRFVDLAEVMRKMTWKGVHSEKLGISTLPCPQATA